MSQSGLAPLPQLVTSADSDNLSAALLFDVQGKQVLVTGGGSGIGFMIASGFVRNGAHVVIASRQQKVLDSAKEELNRLASSSSSGGSCEAVQADLSTVAGIEELVKGLGTLGWSRMDVLVNNSGVAAGAPLHLFTGAKAC
jgi:NAD(P)-dependent dehydrogenase (short-subunit alcohol dehydrogenase family)